MVILGWWRYEGIFPSFLHFCILLAFYNEYVSLFFHKNMKAILKVFLKINNCEDSPELSLEPLSLSIFSNHSFEYCLQAKGSQMYIVTTCLSQLQTHMPNFQLVISSYMLHTYLKFNMYKTSLQTGPPPCLLIPKNGTIFHPHS